MFNKPAHEAIRVLKEQLERYALKAADIAGQDHPDKKRVEHVRSHIKALELELAIQQKRLVELN